MEVSLDTMTDEQFAALTVNALQGLIESHHVAAEKFKAQTPEGAEPDPERLLLAHIADSQIILLAWVFRQATKQKDQEQAQGKKPEEKKLVEVPFFVPPAVMNGARRFRRG